MQQTLESVSSKRRNEEIDSRAEELLSCLM